MQIASLKRLNFLAICPHVFMTAQGSGIKAKLHLAIQMRLLPTNSRQLRIRGHTVVASTNPWSLAEV
jgi:hypothetical protein